MIKDEGDNRPDPQQHGSMKWPGGLVWGVEDSSLDRNFAHGRHDVGHNGSGDEQGSSGVVSAWASVYALLIWHT